MAKNKKQNKKQPQRKRRPAKYLSHSQKLARFPDPRAKALARALADPCNAPLEHGVYPGQMGFISRFAQSFTINTGASGTAWFLTVTPGRGISASSVGATDATAMSVGFSNTFIPGASFMTTNCRGARALGACIEFFTNQNALNATGTYFYGVAPHATIANGAGNYAQTGSLLQHMSKVNAEAYEVKWRPGPMDEFYHPPNNNVSTDDWDDVNSLIVVGTGFPSNVTITAKVTIITEWLPAQTLGFAVPVAANPSQTRPSAVVAAMDAHHPNWWAGKVGNAAQFIWRHGGEQLAGFASTMASSTIARAVTSAVPLLM